ncbi:MAG: type IV secretion system DNA-binding domain-containing protein [Verrucomicrobiota bacterium]
MPTVHEQLSQQFHEWEIRGRGWQMFNEPVFPEPPFVPVHGHYLPATPAIDDGRRPTILSSLFRKLSGQSEPPPIIPEAKKELEPDFLERSDLVELHASLPPTANVSKEVFEQFVLSLANCREPIAFELIGTKESITVQLVAADSDIDLVRHQLEAHFPEAIFTKQISFLETKWNEAEGTEAVIFEFGLSQEFMFQIAVARNFNVDPYIGLVAALSNLRENELALFQVIFEPVRHPWNESILRLVTDGSGKDFFVNRPELSGEAKKKISKPLFAAVVRIAIKSDDRMLDIAKDLAGALTVFSNPGGNEFIPLANSDYDFIDHKEDLLRRQSRRSGMILNSDELVSLVHLPSSSVRAPKLKREVQKTKAAPQLALNPSGLLLGTNTYAGITKEVRLNSEQRVRHTYIIGTSGTGKSTLLFNMIRQDIEDGQGIAVFDPHGDLIDKILGCIPENRIDDVVLVDPSDEEYSIGFNILSAHSDLEKNLLASDLVSVFQRLSTSWGDQMGSVLNNAILAFLESSKGGTLADLQRFLIEPAFRNEFLKTVQDSQVLYYWKKAFPQLTGNKSIGPVLTRLSGFLDRKPVRYMVTQKENKLDFAKIMDGRKIFLAKLSQGQIGNENAYLLGSFLVSKFQQLAMSRQAQAAATRKDFWLYCDEFHNFITPSMAQILNGARKYRLGLVLAHHELRQLQRDTEVSSAVLANPYTRICFRVGDDDARKLGDGFSFFDSKDLQNIPNFQAICRVERADCDFNLSIPYLPEPDEAEAAEIRNRVITASREKYAVSRKQIEVEQIAALLNEEAEPTQKKSAKPLPKAVATEPISPVIAIKPPTEPAQMPVAEKGIFPPQETIAEEPKTTPILQDKGIGGHQHNLIRERIELAARQLGYSTSREDPTGKGGKIDIVLEKPQRAIACEIAITTTIDHEVGNVSKCLNAGFQHIAVISPSADRLEKIAGAVRGSVSREEAARVAFFRPDNFITHLQDLAIQDSAQTTVLEPKEKQYGKYKVKNSVVNLTQDEIKAREEAAFGMIAETMRKKR